jgi:hypothetical protein
MRIFVASFQHNMNQIAPKSRHSPLLVCSSIKFEKFFKLRLKLPNFTGFIHSKKTYFWIESGEGKIAFFGAV